MSEGSEGQVSCLAHREGDTVAVAVQDVEPGNAEVAILSTGARSEVQVTEHIPLGHKLALTDMANGASVIEYGEPIALTLRPIVAGEMVHTHNIRSTKWQIT
jgi:(2R)-sulfolactate sulfo-lyase subunit alpha